MAVAPSGGPARLVLGAALALTLGACPHSCRKHDGPAPPAPPTQHDAAAPSPTPTDDLPPLGGDWIVHLPLDGFGPAAVSVPLGATSPRPLVVGVHARNDRPEWACGEWRGITEARPFILCPHGVPVGAPPEAGLVFAGAERTRREIDAGLDALRARFGRYVAEGPVVYGGFSLGAILGVQIVASDPARFPIAVLGEGGAEEWTPRRVAAFANGGGRRVLFVCSTAYCENVAARPLAALVRAGVAAKLVSAGNIGHLIDDRVIAVVRTAWPWVSGEEQGDASQ
jgi:hypothetical protein